MKSIKTIILATLLTVGSFLTECVNPHSIAVSDMNYSFFDRIGEIRVVGRNKDLYIEKMDGSDSRRITSTAETYERDAFFSKDGRYVVYETDESRHFSGGVADIKYNYFMQLIDGNDTTKIEIDEFMYRDLKKERIIEKNKSE